MESNCACGNPSGSNPECERCRLIARVAELEKYKTIADSFVSLDEKASGKLGQRVAELEADLLDHKQLIADKRESVKDLIERVAELTALCDDKETRLLSVARQIATMKLEQHERVTELTADNQRLRELLRRWLAEMQDPVNIVDDGTLWSNTKAAIG